MKRVAMAAALCAWIAGVAMLGRREDALAAPTAIVRPVALPFLWRSVADAAEHGDPREMFERAQLLLTATPGWADGHSVFAFRYALDGGAEALPPDQRAAAAKDRLLVALRFLEDAREGCGPREPALLADMAWLVELAARNEPLLAPLLDTDPALLADRYLAEAEAKGAGRSVREQRLYDVPRLCAALLRTGDRRSALALLEEAALRCASSGIPDLAGEWRSTLLGIRETLRDEAGTPLEVRDRQKADPRLAALRPFLR